MAETDIVKGLWKFSAPISVVLTLTTWLLFRYSRVTWGAPLTQAETTVVFGAWFAIVSLGHWVWRRCRKKGA
jgi:hypothetical protein